jgi:Ala-tRNA(Pro) deacylase
MNCFERLQAYLNNFQVDYCVQHHAPAFTAQGVAATEHLSGMCMTKVVMVIADGAPTMLVLPAACRVDEERAAEALGAEHVRLATEDEFASRFPDSAIGAMPPFGNLYGVPVYVDSKLAEEDTITFQAGSHTRTISLQYADYEWLAEPKVVDLVVHQLSRQM